MGIPVCGHRQRGTLHEGALSLFDPVAKFIPAFEHARVYRQGSVAAMVSVPASEPMLVWHLMTHTSGLTYDFYFNHPVDEMYRNAGFGTPAAAEYTLEEACARWASISPSTPPLSRRANGVRLPSLVADLPGPARC